MVGTTRCDPMNDAGILAVAVPVDNGPHITHLPNISKTSPSPQIGLDLKRFVVIASPPSPIGRGFHYPSDSKSERQGGRRELGTFAQAIVKTLIRSLPSPVQCGRGPVR